MSVRRWPGAAVAAVAAASLAASLRFPWLAVRSLAADPYRDVGRTELLAQGPIPYEWVLLQAPLAALAVVAVAGAAHAAWPRRRVRRAAAWTLALAGLALAACGTRWVGFYVARLWDPGPSLAHLHAVPYLHLAWGLGLLAWVGPRLWRDLAGRPATGRMPGPDSVLLAAGLLGVLATPLLPHAVLAGPDRFHYDELTLASVGATGGPAAQDVAWALAGLRTLSAALLAVAVAGPWARQAQAPLAAHAAGWAAAVAGACLLALSLALLAWLRDLPLDLRLGPNFLFQALGLVALAAAWAALARPSRLPRDGLPDNR